MTCSKLLVSFISMTSFKCCPTAHAYSLLFHPSTIMPIHRSAAFGHYPSMVRPPPYRRTFSLSSTSSHDDDVEWWKKEAESIITAAAVETGADESCLDILWKPGHVTITVGGDATMSSPLEDDEEVNDEEVDDDKVDDEEVDDEDVMSMESTTTTTQGPDIRAIARSINHALQENADAGSDNDNYTVENTVGWNVATFHEIEVTTPGASEELSGIMFESYRGFDIICDMMDPKTQNSLRLEGKLVDRDEDVTKINLKGRVKKIKNDMITSLRLPKAKREKGSR